MFVPVWLTFLATGLAMAVGTVVWAVSTRQFEDQDRARFIPLLGLEGDGLAARTPRRRPWVHVCHGLIVAMGLFVLAFTGFLALRLP